jgi:hypothetical protein
MNKFNIISIIDKKHINQRALEIFVKSVLLNARDLLEHLIILAPRGDNLSVLIRKLLSDLCIPIYRYPLQDRQDPYIVKFLLEEYLKDYHKDACILYLDPDHILLKSLHFPQHDYDTLLVSSEFSEISLGCQLQDQILTISERPAHSSCNTSLIYGHACTWRRAITSWRSKYNEIGKYTHYRHREEIAFSLASREVDVKLLPVSSSFQGNFASFDNRCALFHYGGEYPETKRIKYFLQKRALSCNYLQLIQTNSSSEAETWAANALRNITS